VAQILLDPLQAILNAIRGSKYEDTEEYKQEKIRSKKLFQRDWEHKVVDYFIALKPNFPAE
jgi:hypothetical protein